MTDVPQFQNGINSEVSVPLTVEKHNPKESEKKGGKVIWKAIYRVKYIDLYINPLLKISHVWRDKTNVLI